MLKGLILTLHELKWQRLEASALFRITGNLALLDHIGRLDAQIAELQPFATELED